MEYLYKEKIAVLGYVVCEKGEMLVKHHMLYRAVYCGLCNSIKKNTTRFLQPFLSYDFVFLALMRLLVTGEEMQLEPMRCKLHPIEKKQRMRDNAALRYAAEASLVLTAEKMLDDLADRDTPFLRRLGERAILPFLQRKRRRLKKKSEAFRALSHEIASLLQETRRLESEGADLDAMCSNFALILSRIFSDSLTGTAESMMRAMGDLLGRFLYTLDALDDWEKDEKDGSFNPLYRQYGKRAEAEASLPEIDLVLSFYIGEMVKILDLASGDENIQKICDNILRRGLVGAVSKRMIAKGEKK